ncbi:Phage antirepressor protein KilAC domain protein [compost metagenome]
MNQLIEINGKMTMSTKEISDLTGKRHDNVMADARKMLGEIGSPEISGGYLDKQDRTQPCLLLSKDETMCLVAGYSTELRFRIVKRWRELEETKKPAELSRIEILQMALESERARVEAEAKLAIAAPKAEFVDRYVDATGTYGFRQVAKMLSVKENWFSDFLIEKAIMYRLSGKLTAHSEHIDAGRFIARAGVAKNDHSYTECRFTAKGVEWVAGEIAKSKAVSAISKK